MNTIPTAIVRNIEVLRDGAAAQYGSDAISGVINLRLRTDRTGGEAAVTYGARITEYDLFNDVPPAGGTWSGPASRKRTDGQSATVSIWKGLALGESGFLTIAAEYKDQKRTERGGYDMRQQYPKLANGAFDPRENTINRFNAWYGDPEMQQTTVFANAGNDLGNGVKLYGWASYQNREARSAGYFRPAQDARNILSIYPDGFLPIIAPTVDDFAATGGVTWSLGGWDMDASLGYGKNKMQFEIQNTLNRSIGPTSKTEFYAGGFSYDQLVFNLTGVRTLDVAGLSSPLNIAVGTEARREGYELFAGEPDSYRYGGQVLPTARRPRRAPRCSRASARPTRSIPTAPRSGAFVDLEANITPQLLASVAVRAEHYSDFGNSLAGKLSGRYDFTKQFALRGSLQNGFRAPSPQQQNFTSTSTNFINGVPFEITTFKPTDAVAVALGAKPLDAEKSVNLSLGARAALRPHQPDGGRLPHQNPRPHRPVGKPDAGERAQLHRSPGLCRRGRRPLLHQWRRHHHRRRRHRHELAGECRRGRALRHHAGGQFQQHRSDQDPGHGPAVGIEPGAGAVRPRQHHRHRRRPAEEQVQRQPELETGPVRRHRARHPLRQDHDAGHRAPRSTSRWPRAPWSTSRAATRSRRN